MGGDPVGDASGLRLCVGILGLLLGVGAWLALPPIHPVRLDNGLPPLLVCAAAAGLGALVVGSRGASSFIIGSAGIVFAVSRILLCVALLP